MLSGLAELQSAPRWPSNGPHYPARATLAFFSCLGHGVSLQTRLGLPSQKLRVGPLVGALWAQTAILRKAPPL